MNAPVAVNVDDALSVGMSLSFWKAESAKEVIELTRRLTPPRTAHSSEVSAGGVPGQLLSGGTTLN